MKKKEQFKQLPDYKKLHLTMKPNKVNLIKESDIYYKAAMNFYRHKRLHDALALLETALDYNPKNMKVHKKLARIFKESGDEFAAASSYNKLLSIDSSCKEAMEYLFDFYLKHHKPAEAAHMSQMRASLEKKKNKKSLLLKQAAQLYQRGGALKLAEEVYLNLLRDNVYDIDIYKELKDIYHQEGCHRKWKICEEILILNNRIDPQKSTGSFKEFKSPGPVTPAVLEKIMHPDEKRFRKFLGWMNPFFALVEKPTLPEILRLSESLEESHPDYILYKECCQYLGMEIPRIRKYNGKAAFKFIADPLEEKDKFSLIYNVKFLDTLTSEEKVFLFCSQLMLIKGGFASLLSLSVSDAAKFFLEIGAVVFSFLILFQKFPIKKVSSIVKKSPKAALTLQLVQALQTKISKFKLMGKDPLEIQELMKRSAVLLPQKELVENPASSFDYKSLMNRRFLETALLGFHYTADRVSYFVVRDLLTSTYSLLRQLADEESIERVEKFGLKSYVENSKNDFFKKRLSQLFYFALDFDFEELDLLSSGTESFNKDKITQKETDL